ncbi:hypothetical protein MAHJHV47_24990 [Mycobacterium avium subsp. hominissuis]
MHRVRTADGVHPDLGETDVPDLAGGDQFGQRSDGVFDRGLAVEAVLVVQVDAVRGQPAQRTIHGDTDIGGAAVQAVAAGVRDQAELGGQHHPIAPPAQRPGQQFLVDVGAVHLGGVNQRHTQLDGAVHGADRFGVVGAGAGVGHRHSHRPQAQPAHLQSAELSLLHGASPVPDVIARGAGR